MARTNTLGNFLTDVADAIRTKKGTQATINAADFDTEIASIPSGGGGATTEKAVNFYDYDGTLVNSYTKTEFLALAEMPEAPTHTGLTFQEWNWSLADAQTYVTNNDEIDIGATYVTDDGATRLYVTLSDGRLKPYLAFAINGTATIDWGDNSATETLTGSSTSTLVSIQHTYSQAGDYVISISSTAKIYFQGISGYSSVVLTKTASPSSSTYNEDRIYIEAIRKIEFGTNINQLSERCFSGTKIETMVISKGITTIAKYSLSFMLSALVIPSGVTTISESGFGSLTHIKKIILPKSITTVEKNAFLGTHNLKKIILPPASVIFNATDIFNQSSTYTNKIPEGTTMVANSLFRGSYNFTKIKLPSTLTRLGTYAFTECYSLLEVEFSPINSLTVDGYAFKNCGNLRKVTFPQNCAMTNCTEMFRGCNNLEEINLPNGFTKADSYFLGNCYSLSSLVIPSTLTSIQANAFNNCYGMAYYDFSNLSSVPTLANVNAFSNMPSDCKIIVPDNLYNDWTADSVWSDSSIVDHIISKSDWDAL